MDRRVQKTREAIQRAYFELLVEKKESRITIADIARRANIDRKTFYLHYDSVETIVREFSKEKIQNILFELEKDDFFGRPIDVVSFFKVLNSFIEQDIDFYRYVATHEAYNFFWDNLYDVLLCTLRDVYLKTTKLTADEFEVYIRYISSGFIVNYRSWLKKEINVSLEELGRLTADMTYYGIQKLFPNVYE